MNIGSWFYGYLVTAQSFRFFRSFLKFTKFTCKKVIDCLVLDDNSPRFHQLCEFCANKSQINYIKEVKKAKKSQKIILCKSSRKKFIVVGVIGVWVLHRPS